MTNEYEAVIEAVPEKGGAYVRFPYDIRRLFKKGRVKAEITFDGEPYTGSIVNRGVKNDDGSICYIIGIRKDIRAKIENSPETPSPLPSRLSLMTDTIYAQCTVTNHLNENKN